MIVNNAFVAVALAFGLMGLFLLIIFGLGVTFKDYKPERPAEPEEQSSFPPGTIITSRADLLMAPPGTVVAFPTKGIFVLDEHGELLPYDGDKPAPLFTGANALVLQSMPEKRR